MVLVIGGYVGNFDFILSVFEWKIVLFNFFMIVFVICFCLKFEFKVFDKFSNLYFDNINVLGVFGLEENIEILGINIVLNFVMSGFFVKV